MERGSVGARERGGDKARIAGCLSVDELGKKG